MGKLCYVIAHSGFFYFCLRVMRRVYVVQNTGVWHGGNLIIACYFYSLALLFVFVSL